MEKSSYNRSIKIHLAYALIFILALELSNRYHKLLETFSKFYRRHFDIVKIQCQTKTTTPARPFKTLRILRLEIYTKKNAGQKFNFSQYHLKTLLLIWFLNVL